MSFLSFLTGNSGSRTSDPALASAKAQQESAPSFTQRIRQTLNPGNWTNPRTWFSKAQTQQRVTINEPAKVQACLEAIRDNSPNASRLVQALNLTDPDVRKAVNKQALDSENIKVLVTIAKLEQIEAEPNPIDEIANWKKVHLPFNLGLLVAQLIQRGIPLSEASCKKFEKALQPFFFTAIRTNGTAFIQKLLDAGFDPNTKIDGVPALLYAYQQNKPEIAAMLIDYEANPWVEHQKTKDYLKNLIETGNVAGVQGYFA